MNDLVKQELHQLIDNCDNELLLSASTKDWWDDLTPEDQNLVMESEVQYLKQEFITHNDLMQQFEEWKKK